MKSLCGLDCNKCDFNSSCKGCVETKGHALGGNCPLAECCIKNELKQCADCKSECTFKDKAIEELNALGVKDMPKVESLNELVGSYINLVYKLPNGQSIQLLDDNDIYLGNQLRKPNSDRCFGVVANEKILLVCEYGINGEDGEIIVYKKR